MTMDATTESIAHFVGLFDIATEQGRLRKSFEEIQQPGRGADELGDPVPLSPDLKAPYGLEPYNPDLDYKPVLVASHGNIQDVFPGGSPPGGAPLVLATRFELPTMDPLALAGPDGDPSIVLMRPPPSSVFSVTHQTARLHDNDVFGADADSDFADTSDLQNAFHAIAREVASLSAFELPLPSGDWAGFAEEAIETILAPTPESGGQLEAHLHRGTDASGTFVDGSHAEEAPDWTDLLPEYLAQKHGFDEDEAPAEGGADSPAGADGSPEQSGSGADGNPGTSAPGSSQAGTATPGKAESGNAEPNATARESDAAPSGSETSADGETGGANTGNSESDEEVTSGGEAVADGKTSGAPTSNSEPADTQSEPGPGEEATTDGEAPADGQSAGGGQYVPAEESPTGAADPETAFNQNESASDGKATQPDSPVQGLSSVQSVTQAASAGTGVADLPVHDFSKDFEDWQGVEDNPAPAEGHEIVSGANFAVNEVSIQVSWLDAPVFVVRGDYTKLQSVSQLNILLENDDVDDKSVGSASEVKNVATMAEEAAAPDDQHDPGIMPQNWSIARVTTDLIAINYVNQDTFATDFDFASVESFGSSFFLGMGENYIFNAALLNEIGFFYDLISVAGDMIEIDMVSQTNFLLDSDRVSGEGAGQANVSGAGNLVYNEAVLKQTGIDEIIPMQASFANLGESLAAGINGAVEDVLQDALFAGTEFLRVLQIDGDFVTVNMVTQKNMVGDADQVHLGSETAQVDGAVDVITGQNGLVNLTSIEKFGLNSTIMAGGQVYEDAMLYQAELIDNGAPPVGVGMAPLINEAIALLIDGMLPPENNESSSDTDVGTDLPGNLDIMQTMLS